MAYAGNSASGAVSTPAPPAIVISNLQANSRDDAAVITWDGDGAAAYAVDIDDDADFTSPQELTASGTTAVAQGLDPDKTYYVRVSAPGASAQSATTSFDTAPQGHLVAAPTLDLSVAASDSVDASWKTVTADDTKFQVQLSTDKKISKPVSKTVSDASIAFTDLKPGTTYYARVRAVDQAGKAISAWSGVEETETPNVAPLTVATFNVGCYKCTGPKLPKWETRRNAVAERINSEAPDVLGVQELAHSKLKGSGVRQFQDLMNRLDSKYQITSCGTSRSASVCKSARNETHVIFNSETVEVVDAGFVALPNTKAAGITRYMSWAVLRQKSTGTEFLFGTAHFRVGSKFAGLRAKQAAAAVSTLRQHGFGSGMPTIMVGDFNSHDDAGAYHTMIAAGLNDPLGQGRGSQRTAEKRIHTNYNSYNWYKRNPPHSAGTNIDFIFTTKMRVSEFETVVKLGSNGKVVGTIPSDHNMVRSVVWLS